MTDQRPSLDQIGCRCSLRLSLRVQVTHRQAPHLRTNACNTRRGGDTGARRSRPSLRRSHSVTRSRLFFGENKDMSYCSVYLSHLDEALDTAGARYIVSGLMVGFSFFIYKNEGVPHWVYL